MCSDFSLNPSPAGIVAFSVCFCTITVFSLYEEYVVRFFLPDGVFLSHDNGLDFLDQLMWEFNQSKSTGAVMVFKITNSNKSGAAHRDELFGYTAYTEQRENHGTMILHGVCYSAYTLR